MSLLLDGYFMFVDTKAEVEGKGTTFWSSEFSLYNDTESCVSFYMRSYSKFSFETRLRIYLFSERFFATLMLIKEYDLTIEESTDWKKLWLKLPRAGKCKLNSIFAWFPYLTAFNH